MLDKILDAAVAEDENVQSRTVTGGSETRDDDGGWVGRAALAAAMRGTRAAAAESVRSEIQAKGAAKIVELAESLGWYRYSGWTRRPRRTRRTRSRRW